jgi:hypothetical protein
MDILSELHAEGRLDASERQRARAVLEALRGWGLSPELDQRRSDIVARLMESPSTPR